MKHIVVIGCGAAGMIAAISAIERNRNVSERSVSDGQADALPGESETKHEICVTVLEKNDRAGKKLYITGKGRCNVTNACETVDFFDHVVRGKKFLYSAVYGYDSICVQRFFEENGCPLKTERGGRVFPVSDHSSDIIRTLAQKMKVLGVRVWYGAEVKRLLLDKRTSGTEGNLLQSGVDEKSKAERNEASETKKDIQEIKCKNKTLRGINEAIQKKKAVTGVQLTTGEIIEADAVIIATGGLSYPTTGSTGDGYVFAKAAGHTVTKCVPALVPFEVAESWCADLQGLSLKNVRLYTEASAASVKSSSTGSAPSRGRASKKRLFDEQGEMLFTHFGISGPLVLTASAVYEEGTTLRMFLDLKPALTKEQLAARIERDFEERRDKQFKNALTDLFPHSLIPVMVMLAESCILPDEKVAGIGKTKVAAFAELIKRVPLTITGTRSFREAVITRGGVNLKEVDPSTMQSKLCDGLYFAGEVLDADAVTGGYNLQIAWSTGHLAGESAAQKIM